MDDRAKKSRFVQYFNPEKRVWVMIDRDCGRIVQISKIMFDCPLLGVTRDFGQERKGIK
ncbi:MAG: hypothetical protein AMQ22_00240 [Candidatus Methanofastidiosum methylothiophilum]|uniref:Uncharacterized protein n=1 Tax=Candidatus Methanofastidiosum methylothiophilum TaxID=1705564 RepID=A0A150J8M2_9EURY|nr:MAG: hypothetical protein APG11_00805 [Candidatus Methanofastidiosum methylthiophilus]KYC53569.1 MAG: hypothetical protein AMQ22_00240 [Candidatus Methanofastidiosum methylthiophilus]